MIRILGRDRRVHVDSAGVQCVRYKGEQVPLAYVRRLARGGERLPDVMRNFPLRTERELTPTEAATLAAVLGASLPSGCLPPGCDVSFSEVLRILSDDFGDNVYLMGGVVRDIVQGKPPALIKDIDINFVIDPDLAVKRLRDRIPNLKVFRSKRADYVSVGDKMQTSFVEGFRVLPEAYGPLNHDATCNMLFVELLEGGRPVLIDPLGGQCARDAIDNVWRAPVPDTEHRAWLAHNPGVIWRMFKFMMRGYKVPDETARSVYGYLADGEISEFHASRAWFTMSDKDLVKIARLIQADTARLGIRCDDLLIRLFEINVVVPNTAEHEKAIASIQRNNQGQDSWKKKKKKRPWTEKK